MLISDIQAYLEEHRAWMKRWRAGRLRRYTSGRDY